jgi:hypothetical protein
MRPEISDKTQIMVEESVDHISNYPSINPDNMTFDEQIQFILEHWWDTNEGKLNSSDPYKRQPWYDKV